MRWSIIRLIWVRELRDQLRDRRTVFMIAVLPVLLYPLAGLGVMQLARGFFGQTNVVGIAGLDNLLPWSPPPAPPTPASVVGWLALTPAPPGDPGAFACQLAGAVGLHLAQPRLDYPALLKERDGRIVFVERYQEGRAGGNGVGDGKLILRRLEVAVTDHQDPDAFLKGPTGQMLKDRQIDLLLVVPPGFQERLGNGDKPVLYVLGRDKDETSRLVNQRVTSALTRWRKDLKEVRLARHGLPRDFDEPVRVYDPERAKPTARQEEENLFTLLVRIFPFILVMWSLAGALYPAVDLCAGEKERGTMETLLISPASREEIVCGKFLTIWVFSAGTALLNLLSMAFTTYPFSTALPGATFSPLALFWGVALLLPLSAFFSALCLAVGAYARSSKEGQYYLMPLFLVTMPLIFLTLAPGVELNPFYSMVPVTGVALLLQKLMAARSADHGLWLYFVPVLLPTVVYSWLALRWAIGQFNREEVLFREAERLDIGLWLKRLLREKEPLPNTGEAIFCFALILALRWFSLGIGSHLPLLMRTGVGQIAFVATPPLFMALLLTTRPGHGLGIRRAPWWVWPAALLLPLVVVPPLTELTLAILRQFPALRTLLELNHPLTRELRSLATGATVVSPGQYFLVLAVLPALCEELAFRGFILVGLLRGFRPWTAILLNAFLFALYQMNVFQFLPHFVFGVILALLVVRSGSVLPAMAFHLVYNSLVIAPALLPDVRTLLEGLAVSSDASSGPTTLRLFVSAACALLAAAGLAVVWFAGKPRPMARGVTG